MDMPQKMPAITEAMILAVLMAGLAAISKLLEAFGVYHLSQEQTAALGETLKWLVLLGGFVVLADAYLRGERNKRLAQTDPQAAEIAKTNAEAVKVQAQAAASSARAREMAAQTAAQNAADQQRAIAAAVAEQLKAAEEASKSNGPGDDQPAA